MVTLSTPPKALLLPLAASPNLLYAHIFHTRFTHGSHLLHVRRQHQVDHILSQLLSDMNARSMQGRGARM